ncbi:anti-anti-sigma factor [Trichlorobacter thiogenes]|uniref:Anti-sigma factor antagonist n=1 Tax=Trichlorobacter thiogenes TaxID=115783 RepID=A0A1T4NHD6_9BACT|nr:STAS domain-containing protein [Trichlorobacter thiogenes]SJZ78669.1 anti-anti-sigma factor [Trichlorobacter thiogenes]
MQITVTTQAGVTIAALVGRMDAMTTVEFDRWLAEQLTNGETRFVLDMHGLEYISSAGLRSLLAAAKQVKTKNGALLLCNLGGTVEEVFRISGFLAILPSFPNVEEACVSLA